jgi:hypothetical protein
MKTKEEVEKLAKNFANDSHGSPTAIFLEKGFINGYYKCQEDISIEKSKVLKNKADLYFVAEKFYIDKYFKGIEPLKKENKDFVRDRIFPFIDGIVYILTNKTKAENTK